MKYNSDIVTAARLAWNDISTLVDEKPNIHETNETFNLFYATLIEKLEEEEAGE